MTWSEESLKVLSVGLGFSGRGGGWVSGVSFAIFGPYYDQVELNNKSLNTIKEHKHSPVMLLIFSRHQDAFSTLSGKYGTFHCWVNFESF